MDAQASGRQQPENERPETAPESSRSVSVASNDGGRPDAATEASPFQGTSTNNEGLVHAMPVSEEEEPPEGRMEAQPVDVEEANQRKEQEKRRRLGFLIVSILCIAVAATVAGLLTNNLESRPDNIVFNTTVPITIAPTVSKAPSLSPSAAPTALVDSSKATYCESR